MGTPKNIGRMIGLLSLVQFASGVLVNFVLMAPVVAAPGFLVNAASHSLQVGLSVLLGLLTGMLSVGIAITAFPLFRSYSQTLALWFVALSVVGFSAAAIENMNVMSLLSLSEAYSNASASGKEPFEGLRVVVASARNWAHYVGLIISGCTIFVFYGALFRFALVPRALAAFGLGAVVLQIIAVAMPLFGQAILFVMLLPLGLCHLVMALWLIARGFEGCPQSGSLSPD